MKALVTILLGISLPAGAAVVTVTVTDTTGARLVDTVIYAVPADPAPITQTDDIRIEQSNREFRPFVSVTAVGTTAYFPNRDGIGHHVYSFSKVKVFQLPLSEAEITEPVRFDTPGVVTVGCNIHDWMVGYIYVVDTPYYAVTGNDGQVNLQLPDGNYTLHVWHPGMKADSDLKEVITLSGGAGDQLGFTLDIRPEYFWKPERPPGNLEELY